MYKWNDEKIKRTFEREKQYALKEFTEEELEVLYLNKLSKQTKSRRILRMISLAYTLGKLKGIQAVDEGKTPVTLR